MDFEYLIEVKSENCQVRNVLTAVSVVPTKELFSGKNVSKTAYLVQYFIACTLNCPFSTGYGHFVALTLTPHFITDYFVAK